MTWCTDSSATGVTMAGQRPELEPARSSVLLGHAMSFACVAALCGRVGGRVEIDGSSPDRTVLSTAGRSCRLVVRWPYPAGLRDSWAKACYFSDLAGGFGCSLEFPGPTTLLGKWAFH